MSRRLLLSIAICGAGAVLALGYPSRLPYSQSGWVIADRWDGLYVCDGHTVVAVSKDLAGRFQPYRGKYVYINVDKIQRSAADPGPWRIDGIKEIKEPDQPVPDPYPVALKASAANPKKTAAEVALQLAIEYRGDDERRIGLEDVSLVIVRRKDANGRPEINMFLTYRLSNGASYEHFSEKLSGLALRGPADTASVTGAQTFRWAISVRKKLPPGEYQAWLVYHDPQRENDCGAVSVPVAFAVGG